MKKLLFILISVLFTAVACAQTKYNLIIQKSAPMVYLNGAGGQIKFLNTPAITITQSAGVLTLAGGNFSMGANSLLGTGAVGATGAGKHSKGWFVDAEFTNPPTINGVSMTSIYAPIASLSAKQDILITGTNLKTVGGFDLLGSGDIPIAGTGTMTSVSVTSANGVSATIANPSTSAALTFSLGAITPTSVNSIVFTGASTPRLTVSGTTSVSGANTGDNAVNSLYSSLVSNATHTGDVTGANALTITNGSVTLPKMANMATASLIYRKTAGTGVPEVQTLATLKADLNLSGTNTGDQTNITGNAATATILQTGRAINGVSFNGSAPITVPSNITPGTIGNFMASNGSVWYSKTPADTLSVTNGIPVPQLTTTQINNLISPAEGQLVYDITLHVMKFWNGSVYKTITTN